MSISVRTIFLIAFLSPTLAHADLYDGLGASTAIGPALIAQGSVWFLATPEEEDATYLYRTNGTAAGTEKIFASERFPNILPRPVARDGGIFFLTEKSGTIHLSRTDVATGNTTDLFDTHDSDVRPDLVDFGGRLYFVTSAGRGDMQRLWRSDGTAAGTVAVIQGRPSISSLTIAGSHLFFEDEGLWVTDGVSAPATIGPRANTLVPLGERLMFRDGNNLATSDGTPAGTFTFLPHISALESGIAANGSYCFVLTENRELWRTDGTIAGTVRIATFQTAAGGLVTLGGRGYFFLRRNLIFELWTSDGTPNGTRMVTNIPTRTTLLDVLGAVGNNIFFGLEDAEGFELWKSDGTPGGTARAVDLAKGRRLDGSARDSVFGTSADFNGKLFFAANDGIHGQEPWISDGTDAGTIMLANIAPEGAIRGRLMDAVTGAPVSDALVLLYAVNSGGGLAAMRTFDALPDGTYAAEGLSDGNFAVRAVSRDGHQTAFWRAPNCTNCANYSTVTVTGTATTSGIDFALERGGRISGRVVDQHGAPLRGVDIAVSASVGGSVIATARTAADGTYITNPGLPDGSWVVTASTFLYSSVIYDNVSCSRGCDASTVVTHVSPGKDILPNVNFTLGEWGRVRGRVLSARTGKALERTTVVHIVSDGPGSINSTFMTATANPDFEIALPDGKWHLSVQATEISPSTWYPNVPCPSTGGCTLAGTVVTVAPGTLNTGYDIVVPFTGGIISGRVADDVSGTPIAGVEVELYSGTGYRITTATSAADGSYELAFGASGSFYVKAEERYPYGAELYDGGAGKVCSSCDVKTGQAVHAAAGTTTTGIDFTLHDCHCQPPRRRPSHS